MGLNKEGAPSSSCRLQSRPRIDPPPPPFFASQPSYRPLRWDLKSCDVGAQVGKEKEMGRGEIPPNVQEGDLLK